MGKCSKCGKRIRYNQFKRYRGKILCYECYDTRLERKKARQEKAEKKLEEDKAKMDNYDFGDLTNTGETDDDGKSPDLQ